MRRKMFLLSALALMVAGGIFWSCQKDEVVMNSTDAVLLKSVSANYPESCDDVCIDLSLGDDVIYYEKSGSFYGNIGGNSKSIGYTVYNTEESFVVELSYTRTPASSGSSSTIQVTVDGEIQSTTIANGGSDVLEFPLAADWEACDEVVWALEETEYDGDQITGGGVYELIGICTDCKDELTTTLTYCGDVKTLIVTFTAEEAGSVVIQGGLTNGTTIITAESNILTRNTTHSGVENNNANVTRWEGDVDACEKVTITITFSDGNGVDDWTAKRGDDLLDEAEAIASAIEKCPE